MWNRITECFVFFGHYSTCAFLVVMAYERYILVARATESVQLLSLRRRVCVYCLAASAAILLATMCSLEHHHWIADRKSLVYPFSQTLKSLSKQTLKLFFSFCPAGVGFVSRTMTFQLGGHISATVHLAHSPGLFSFLLESDSQPAANQQKSQDEEGAQRSAISGPHSSHNHLVRVVGAGCFGETHPRAASLPVLVSQIMT